MSKYYVVEVGVFGTPEMSGYEVDLHFASGIKKMNLYDEDVSGFNNLHDAKRYVNNYVEYGVLGTYGFIWESEAVNTYDRDLVLYFRHKTEDTSQLAKSLLTIREHLYKICELQTPAGDVLINEMGLEDYPFNKSLDEVATDFNNYVVEIINKDGVLE